MTRNISLDPALVYLAQLPPDQRTRTNVTEILQQIAKQGFITYEILQQLGLIHEVVTDSYGRGIVTGSKTMPDSSEILVVTVPKLYAPAIHDHGVDSAGANLLAVSGSFYNINYKHDDKPLGGRRLVHKSIQLIRTGDVAFIPGGHAGMHRVVNTGDSPHVSFNFYWSGRPSTDFESETYVYDYSGKTGTRVTTSGPAFFFAGGENPRSGFSCSSLVRLEDLVYQHIQLSAAKEQNQLTPERDLLLNEIKAVFSGLEINTIIARARPQAESLSRQDGVAKGYFETLFALAREIENKYSERGRPAARQLGFELKHS